MQDDAISVCTARGHDHRRGHNAAAQEIEANPARNARLGHVATPEPVGGIRASSIKTQGMDPVKMGVGV